MKHEVSSARYWNIQECTIPVGRVTIITSFCKGGEDCDECIKFCPEKVLELSTIRNERGFFPPVLVDEEQCTVCGRCQLYCSENAIFVEKIGERVVTPDEIAPREENSQ
ncbi:MAG: ferredoxin family protein [Desulfobacterales bacterium]|nr:MAG: ferredoxin family protein [Desulfobacterales bacterium]